jgi:carbonic anhydrase
MTPEQAITRLKEGNLRFISGTRSVEPMFSHLKLRELAVNGQKPFAIVLTCSDSRCPAEMIFDQGLGDLFVIRVAGNVVAPSLLASIEFAAANFGSAVVLVLGHTQCGAVTDTVQHARDPLTPLLSPHLEELVGRIRPAVETALRSVPLDHPDLLQNSIRENVFRSMRLIRSQSAIVNDLVKANRLWVQGAILDLSTGRIDFLNESRSN